VQYNGYSWDLEQRSKSERRTLFNPYFVAMYCNSGKMKDYWGQTTSASLVTRFPDIVSIDFNSRSSTVMRRSTLMMPWFPSDDTLQDCVRKLVEAGYLTIVDVLDDEPRPGANAAAPRDGDVFLGFPNEQIRKSCESDYFSSLLPKNFRKLPAFQTGKAALEKGDMVSLFKSMNDFFLSVPYYITTRFDYEEAWSFFAFTVLSSMGLGENLVSEDTSQRGRSDIVIFLNGVIYVLELKAVQAKGKTEPLENKAREAIQQIGGYLKSSFVSSRLAQSSKVVLVGVVADTTQGKKGFAMISIKEISPQNVSLPLDDEGVKLFQLREGDK
jgi:PD-(D/E)XK nuclease superfamily